MTADICYRVLDLLRGAKRLPPDELGNAQAVADLSLSYGVIASAVSTGAGMSPAVELLYESRPRSARELRGLAAQLRQGLGYTPADARLAYVFLDFSHRAVDAHRPDTARVLSTLARRVELKTFSDVRGALGALRQDMTPEMLAAVAGRYASHPLLPPVAQLMAAHGIPLPPDPLAE